MKVGKWKLLLPLALLGVGAAVTTSGALATPAQTAVKVAVVTRLQGSVRLRLRARHRWRERRVLGVRGRKAEKQEEALGRHHRRQRGWCRPTFTGYGCGDDTPATMLKEIRRLMVQRCRRDGRSTLGDEAVATANWAKSHPDKTIIIGTAASQDPTMQIAPKNLFRYHGDGAQWNAGLGEVVYKKWGWRNAAIIMDDYSFAWTSARGHHHRLLCNRRQDHQTRFPAAEHDGLLGVRPAIAGA